jgi:hypothetical protein
MPEEDTKIPAAGEGQDSSKAGEGQADNRNDSATDTGEDGGNGEGTDAGKDGEGKTKTDNGDGSQDGNDDDQDDGAEPPEKKRLSKQDFIIGRQRKKLAKQAKAGDGEGEGDGDKGNDGEDDEDGISPEDEEVITKVVSKRFAPVIEKTLQAEDEQEVQDFLKTNPDFKPFEARARRFMQHPSRRNLPIKSIFYEVAGDKLIKIGAERQKQADQKAKEGQTGGGSNRDGDTTKSVKELSQDDFAKKQEEVRRGKR